MYLRIPGGWSASAKEANTSKSRCWSKYSKHGPAATQGPMPPTVVA